MNPFEDVTSQNKELAIYPVEIAAAPRTLVDVLIASANNYPDSLAVDNGSESLTYSQLIKEVEEQAALLQSIGVRAGDRVGIHIKSGTIRLYSSILAVLFSGAAYVPVDVDDPAERAELVWSESKVSAIVKDDAKILTRLPSMGSTARRPATDDDAWIIFTSGSTGKPKGVAVTHRSAAAFVDAEAQIFLPNKPLSPGDRVLAGLSVAFDASCEEMWLAWRYGACLVPASRSLVKSGADLGNFLIEQSISVVSTVPTLAALWPPETFSRVRLLILGGEACPPELSTRLSSTVDSVWNTYGPTEATVVSCAAQLFPGEQVSIGLPLPGWKLAVVNSEGAAVRWGEEGELIIGGVGMARYLDENKDKEKFAPAAVFGGERAYRSGDLVRAERDGLFFLGRNDEQIKFGGRRIELGEIDAALMALPGVSAAATAIKYTEMGSQVLVGYLVCSRPVGEKDRSQLRQMLPPTLVPMLVLVDDLPVRTSGKVDRKALPWPLTQSSLPDVGVHDSTMAWVAEKWRCVLGIAASPNSHFFDLGGTSLGAAQLISQLREKCPTLSIADVYENPTLSKMSARVDEISGTKQGRRDVTPTTRWVVTVQTAVLILQLVLEAMRWISALALSKKFFSLRLAGSSWANQHEIPWWLIVAGWVLFISMPGRLLTTAGLVRLLTVKMAPGTYQRGSSTHLRLWAAERVAALGRLGAISGTQWCLRYAQLLGCRVGANVQLHGLPPVTGLADFGSDCAIEPEADVGGWWLDGDLLHIGSVTIGESARVGARSTLMPNAVVEPFSIVKPGTSVEGTVKGPSVSVTSLEKTETELNKRCFWPGFRYTSSILFLDFLPAFLIAPIWGLTPALVHDWSDFRQLAIALLQMTLPGAFLGLLLYGIFIVIVVRLASLVIRPGVHSWHSSAAWAAWLVHFLMMDARSTLFPIYASLLAPYWLRMLGAKIGASVEASTVVPLPSLLRVHDGAFLADDVLLSPFKLYRGTISFGTTSIGVKSFAGNSAIIDGGIEVPDGVLIGVLGTAPDQRQMDIGSPWLGRPPMPLPRRKETTVDETRTFKPPGRLVFARSLVESCRIVPLLIASMLATLVGVITLWVMNKFGVSYAILACTGLLLGAGVTACFTATVAKWLLTPVIRAGQQRPLWSPFVWRNELCDTFIQSLAVPWLARLCYGTPILNFWMRSLGAKLGRGVWLESHLLPEAELVQLDAGVTINRGCVCQTHLFHDRLMRLDRVHLQAGATLGPYAITLPGTVIGAGTTIAPTSLVMRGEHIPAGSHWKGNPVRPWSSEKARSASESSDSDAARSF